MVVFHKPLGLDIYYPLLIVETRFDSQNHITVLDHPIAKLGQYFDFILAADLAELDMTTIKTILHVRLPTMISLDQTFQIDAAIFQNTIWRIFFGWHIRDHDTGKLPEDVHDADIDQEIGELIAQNVGNAFACESHVQTVSDHGHSPLVWVVLYAMNLNGC